MADELEASSSKTPPSKPSTKRKSAPTPAPSKKIPPIKREDSPSSYTPSTQSAAHELYNACVTTERGNKPFEKLWDTSALWALCEDQKIEIKTIVELPELCQFLLDQKLFRGVQYNKATCFRLRTHKAAELVRKLRNQDDADVYELIESAERNGKWNRALKNETKLAQTRIDAALKRLVAASYVKLMKSAKFPGRKYYILAHLQPLEEISGGAFYSDGELDVDFITTVSDVVCNYIEQQSWRSLARAPPDWRLSSKHAERLRKRSAGADGMPRTAHVRARPPEGTGPPRYPAVLDSRARAFVTAHPPSYTDYDTPSSVLTWLDASGLIRGKDLSRADVAALLEMLVFDGRLERMGRKRVAIDIEAPEDDEPGSDEERAVAAAGKSKRKASDAFEGNGKGKGKSKAEGDRESKDDVKADEPSHRPKRRKVGSDGKEDLSASSSSDEDEPEEPPKKGKAAPQPQPQTLEEIETMYRTVLRQSMVDGAARNALGETPCGVCPVFDACEGLAIEDFDGGGADGRGARYAYGGRVGSRSKVNPRDCRYLPEWLKGKAGEKGQAEPKGAEPKG